MSAGKRRNFPTTRFNAKKKIHSKKKKKKKKVVSFPFHTKNNKKWISIGDDDSRDDNDERETIFRWSAAKKRKTHYSGFIFDAFATLSLSLSLLDSISFFFVVRGNIKCGRTLFFFVSSHHQTSLSKVLRVPFKKKKKKKVRRIIP